MCINGGALRNLVRDVNNFLGKLSVHACAAGPLAHTKGIVLVISKHEEGIMGCFVSSFLW